MIETSGDYLTMIETTGKFAGYGSAGKFALKYFHLS